MHLLRASQSTQLLNFTMSQYDTMTADTTRTNAYSQALHEIVNDGDLVVDIGTGPFVLLARQAVRAGAGRVFALEANGDAAKAARRFRNTSPDSWTSKIEL